MNGPNLQARLLRLTEVKQLLPGFSTSSALPTTQCLSTAVCFHSIQTEDKMKFNCWHQEHMVTWEINWIWICIWEFCSISNYPVAQKSSCYTASEIIQWRKHVIYLTEWCNLQVKGIKFSFSIIVHFII